ncbi:MAG: carboxy-S-adenosyl-L-methionine synthase CmoA [Gammaproteobacteria bacterium]|nr:carboxy-S-adenosyl-L-methionine synthase CmoA [Gammaproteobacteria bacterium]
MTDSGGRDTLFSEERPGPDGFVFDEAVAAVFPDMIKRSVPGYVAVINMIQLLAGRYAQPGSLLLDLGCSLGASTVALARGAAGRGCRVVGVDNAPAMLTQARELTAHSHLSIEWQCADVRDVEITGASVVVMNFTLQFLPPGDRLAMLRRIRDGLEPEGVLILSEKIAGADAQEDALLIEMHHAFKRANGYSELEISRKRSALENVLVPETLAVHRERLSEAGFARSDLWFQCFNFVSLVARR